MGLKTQITRRKEITTSDGSTWTTLVTIPVPAATRAVVDIEFIVEASATDNSEIATARGMHQARRIAGVLGMIGNISFNKNFNTGSSAALKLCNARIQESGDNIQLQVRGVTARPLEWYGKLVLLIS